MLLCYSWKSGFPTLAIGNSKNEIRYRDRWREKAQREACLWKKVIIILLLLKKVDSARLRERDIHPISPKTPAPQYQPLDRKKRDWKIVEDYSWEKAA